MNAHYSSPWSRRALEAIRELADKGHPFTSDDVRFIAGDPPEPNQLGAVFADAKALGLISYVRHVPSKRKESKGRRVGEWVAAESPQGALL